MNHPLVSIVLPVHNEADYVSSVVESYDEALALFPNPREFILVTNGCRDNSLEVCRTLAEKNRRVRVKDTAMRGWGLAVKIGVQEARGEILCYTNLARTSPQNLASHLGYAIAHPQTVIKAQRQSRDNWRRRLGALLYNFECRVFFDLKCWDINGTPKVFPRSFDKLLALTRDDDLIDAEFNMICRREGYPILEVPVSGHGRHGGKTSTSYRSAIRMYWRVYRMWRTYGMPSDQPLLSREERWKLGAG